MWHDKLFRSLYDISPFLEYVLQCDAVSCSVLQCVEVCCRVCCSVLQYVSHDKLGPRPLWYLPILEYMLQCVAVCCSVLQCVAVCCSVLQCVAVYCSTRDMTHSSAASMISPQCYSVLQRVAVRVAVRCSVVHYEWCDVILRSLYSTAYCIWSVI